MRLRFYDDAFEGEGTIPASIFLAGPTARGVPRTPWRAEALERLNGLGFGGCESPVPGMRPVSFGVLAWETAGIERSSVVLFWMPFRVLAEDDPASLPGFTTRAEVARELARDPIAATLEETLASAVARI